MTKILPEVIQANLLSITVKILEIAIAARLTDIANTSERSSKRQYGFRPGRSTEYAIVELKRIVRSAQGNYAVGLLFDISGAFDNVWWPSILGSLKARNCQRNIYGLISSCLSDRKATFVGASGTVGKEVSKVCPQGSVLEPLF